MSHQNDYIIALKKTNELIDELLNEDFEAGAAFSGMLTAVVYRLMISAEDKHDVTGIIGGSMASAAAHIEMQDDFLKDIH